MRFYMVFSEPQKAEPPILLRDGPSFAAPFFGPLWLMWHGMWLATALYLCVATLPFLCFYYITPAGDILGSLLSFTTLFALALEGNHIRAWHLKRKGRICEAVIAARSRDAALLRYWESLSPPDNQSEGGL